MSKATARARVICSRSFPGARAAVVFVCGAVALMSLYATASGQEGVFLTEDQAPAAVFPSADRFERDEVPATPELRQHVRALLSPSEPSVWEDQYVIFKASKGAALLGYAIIVEEIGKHRPITFVVGVRPDERVNDVAVMAYREAYGGEVKNKRFLGQYRGHSSADPLQPFTDIKNIAGATLSVDAAGRAVKKALAVAQVVFGAGGGA